MQTRFEVTKGVDMQERRRGIWAPLATAAVYTGLQNALGAYRSRTEVVQRYLKVKPNERFLDIGCGPADILDFLPPVQYFGIDLSPTYIAKARERFGDRGRFEVADVGDPNVVQDGLFDVAHGGGLLHHLDDATCADLFRKVFARLKDGGRAIFVDPAWEPNQNLIAKTLISADRGRHVRTADQYKALAGSAFTQVETRLVRDLLRFPYTHCITSCFRRSS